MRYENIMMRGLKIKEGSEDPWLNSGAHGQFKLNSHSNSTEFVETGLAVSGWELLYNLPSSSSLNMPHGCLPLAGEQCQQRQSFRWDSGWQDNLLLLGKFHPVNSCSLHQPATGLALLITKVKNRKSWTFPKSLNQTWFVFVTESLPLVPVAPFRK